MTARAAVYSLLSGDATLAGLGVGAVIPTNAVDTPTEECFLIVRWNDNTRVFGRRGSNLLAVWAHDKNRDYGRITAVLERVEDLLTGTVHRVGADGWIMTQADCNGQGPDLFDSGYETCTRYAEFTVVARRQEEE